MRVSGLTKTTVFPGKEPKLAVCLLGLEQALFEGSFSDEPLIELLLSRIGART